MTNELYRCNMEHRETEREGQKKMKVRHTKGKGEMNSVRMMTMV